MLTKKSNATITSGMSDFPIITHPDERLRLISEEIKEINSSIRHLAEQMLESMYESSGFGLAAIQVAVPKRLVVMDLSKREGERNPVVLINPELLGVGEEISTFNEGCLSLPELYVDIDRPTSIAVRYQDLNGKQHEHTIDGLFARCFQHELDHLNGILIIDHLSRLRRQMALKKYQKLRQQKAEVSDPE